MHRKWCGDVRAALDNRPPSFLVRDAAAIAGWRRIRGIERPRGKGMRRRVPLISFVCLLTTVLLSQSSSELAEQEAVSQIKHTLASRLDSRLPKVSLEYFFSYEAGGSAVRWEVNDCNPQVGPAVNKHKGDFLICVEADFNRNDRSVNVFISVATAIHKEQSAPAFFDATVTEVDGSRHALKRLADLPSALHQPAPSSPRDLSDPAETRRASSIFSVLLCGAPNACWHRA